MTKIARIYQMYIKQSIASIAYNAIMKVQFLKTRFKYYLSNNSILERHYHSFTEKYKITFIKEFLLWVFKSTVETINRFNHYVSIGVLSQKDVIGIQKVFEV